MNTRKSGMIAAMAALTTMVSVGSAKAQTGILHRHPTASGIAAGVAAHHAAKVTGRRRAAHGGHRNFAQRHPVLSGIAAGAATHHVLKHHH